MTAGVNTSVKLCAFVINALKLEQFTFFNGVMVFIKYICCFRVRLVVSVGVSSILYISS